MIAGEPEHYREEGTNRSEDADDTAARNDDLEHGENKGKKEKQGDQHSASSQALMNIGAKISVGLMNYSCRNR